MDLNETTINALTIGDDVKAELLKLFGQVKAKETELDKLRAKVPTDSQKVVEGVDHDRFIAATAELQALKDSMKSKLDDNATKKDAPLLAAFSAFFGE